MFDLSHLEKSSSYTYTTVSSTLKHGGDLAQWEDSTHKRCQLGILGVHLNAGSYISHGWTAFSWIGVNSIEILFEFRQCSTSLQAKRTTYKNRQHDWMQLKRLWYVPSTPGINSFCYLKQVNLPCPFSRNIIFDSGRKLQPVTIISCPPFTEQLLMLYFSIWGSSWADLWASWKRKRKMHKKACKYNSYHLSLSSPRLCHFYFTGTTRFPIFSWTVV